MSTPFRKTIMTVVLLLVSTLSWAAGQPPRSGLTMADVEKVAGMPKAKHDAVGQPPITRWDYEGYSVYFEFDRVIHTVTH